MNKKLLSELDGTITNIFVPEKFGQYGYVLEDQVNIICLEIETKEGKIKIIKPRDSKYSKLFVKDKVLLKKYSLDYAYPKYLKEIKNIINNYYSVHSEEYKKLMYRKYCCSENEYNQNPRRIIDYEIVF